MLGFPTISSIIAAFRLNTKNAPNVLSVMFVHIAMSEKRKQQDYLGFMTGEAGDFIVDIDTQEIIETRYFE